MAQEDPDTPEVQTPGVVVHAERTPDGYAVFYSVVGGLDPLAVPALLELGCKAARENLGLT